MLIFELTKLIVMTDIATLEARIREDAERKIGVAKTLAEVRGTLVSAREEFARADAANLAAFKDALKQAREAGFTERELSVLKLDDPSGAKKPSRSPRPARRKTDPVQDPQSGK